MHSTITLAFVFFLLNGKRVSAGLRLRETRAVSAVGLPCGNEIDAAATARRALVELHD